MRFGRRKKDEQRDVPAEVPVEQPADDTEADDATAGPRANGPWDAGEVEFDEQDSERLDLGSLVVKAHPNVEVQIPADPDSGVAEAVVLVSEDSAVELRAFAATRRGGLWGDVLGEIVEEVEKVGGESEEVDGPYGRELAVQVPVETPDGEPAVQPTRIVGIEGPRWLLRATFMGRAALNPDPDGVLEQAVGDLVVVRGSEPMAPREMIPVTLPEGAVLVDEDDDEQGDS